MQCYRRGGCGPYEMLSCSECPASKQEYVRKNSAAQDIPVDSIQNDAYLLSCKCPSCMSTLGRGYDEEFVFCKRCGKKLHLPAFSQAEIEKAMFEKEMDRYED